MDGRGWGFLGFPLTSILSPCRGRGGVWGYFLITLEARLGFASILNLSLNLILNLILNILPLDIFVGHSVISTLIAAAAASPLRTPLAEFAVRTVMLLILALFQTADESVGRHLKAHSILTDKCLFIVGHLLWSRICFQPKLKNCFAIRFLQKL